MKTPLLNKIESGALALTIAALFTVAFVTACRRETPPAAAPAAEIRPATPVATSQPARAVAAPQENPLVLQLPVSSGRMTETFSTWADMKQAETSLGMR